MPDNKLPKPSDILGKSTLPSPSDILGPGVKKKAQPVASVTGGLGSAFGSPTFQPTKDYVPAPLIGEGVDDYQKEEARKQAAAERLSNKLKTQQAAYLAGQGEQGFIDVEDAKLKSDYNQLQAVIQKDLGNTGNRATYTYNKLLEGAGSVISGGIDAGLNALRYAQPMSPFVTDATILDYRTNIAPEVKGFLKETIGADVDKGAERKYDEEFITGTIGGLAYSVPAMVTPFGIGLYSQAYDSGLDLINSTDAGKGLTEAEKTLFAAGLGSVVGQLEKIGLNKILGRTASSELVNGLTFKAINNLSKSGSKITAEAIGDFAGNALRKTKNKLLNSADQGYRAFLDEFTTGSLQEGATIGAEQAVNVLKNKDIFETQNMGEMFGRVLKSGVAEGVGGAVIGAGKGGLMVNTKNYIVDKISNARSFDDVRNLLLDIEKVGEDNNYSPEEIEEVVNTVNDIAQKREKLPQDLTPAQATGIVNLMVDRDELTDNLKELEVELNNTDDALKPAKVGDIELAKKRISAINAKISEIAQNPNYAIQKPSTTSQVPPVIEGGQNLQEGGEGVRQSVEGQEATQEVVPEEVTRLRAQEQQELAESIPNIEDYRVDGKIDKNLITNPEDLKKYEDIYDKYDKLITPLLPQEKTNISKPVTGQKVVVSGVKYAVPSTEEQDTLISQRTDKSYFDAKVNELPSSPLTSEQVDEVLTNGQFGILTGQNPMGQPVPDVVNNKLNTKAKKWLKSKGYSFFDVAGKYGQTEGSLLVPNLTTKDAIEFAKEFNQESVITNDGLVYQDGSMNPRVKEEDSFTVDVSKPDADFASAIKLSDGSVKGFSLGLNFDETVKAPEVKQESVSEKKVPAKRKEKAVPAKKEKELAQLVKDGNIDEFLKQINNIGDVEFSTKIVENTQDQSFDAIVDEMNQLGDTKVAFNIDDEISDGGTIDIEGVQEREGLVKKPKYVKISDFAGKPIMLTISDQLSSGNTVNPFTGNSVEDLNGGLFFNYTKGNTESGWAYTDLDTANDVLNIAKELYNNNPELYPDGIVPTAVVKMGEDSITSNEAIARVLSDNLKTFPEANKKAAFKAVKVEIKRLLDASIKNVKEAEAADKINKNAVKDSKIYSNILDYLNKFNTLDEAVDYNNIKTLPIATRPYLIKRFTVGSPAVNLPKITKGAIKTYVAKALLNGLPIDMVKGIHLAYVTNTVSEKALDNVPSRHIMSFVGIDAKADAPIKSNHPNYPYALKGKGLGIVKNTKHLASVFPQAYGNSISKYLSGKAETPSKAISQAIFGGLKDILYRNKSLNINNDNVAKLIGFMNVAFPSVRFMSDANSWNDIINSDNVQKHIVNGETIYGLTTNGDIYINPEFKDLNTPIHEMGHIWIDFVQTTNSKLYDKGLQLVDNTPEFEASKEVYGDTDKARKEALALLIGNRGETIANASQKSKFKKWLLGMWEYLQTKFPSLRDLSIKQIENLTLDQFVGGALRDIVGGKEITKDLSALKMSDQFRGEVNFKSVKADAVDVLSRMLKSKLITQEQYNNAMERVGATTSIRNAEVEAKRAEYGFPKSDKTVYKPLAVGLEEAKQAIKDGVSANDIIEKALNREPITDVESNIITLYIATKQAELIKANSEIEQNQSSGALDFTEAVDKRNRVIDDLVKAYDAGKASGTVSSRALNARKNKVLEDDSFANMLIQKRKANNNRKLTNKQIDELTKLHTKLQATKALLEIKIEKLNEENAKLKLRNAAPKIVKEVKAESTGKTKEQLKAEREDIFKQMSELTRKSLSNLSMNPIPAEMIPLVVKLAKNYLATGAKTLDEVIDKVQADLSGYIENVSKNDIRRTLADYDADTRPTKEDIQDEVFGERSKEKQIKDIEDLENQAKKEKDPEVAQLLLDEANAKRTAMEKQAEKDGLDKEQSRLDNYKKNIQKRIDELQGKLKKGDYSKTPKNEIKLDDEARKLKKQLEDIKFQFAVELEKDALKSRNQLEKAVDVVVEVSNTPRALMATADFSAPLRQGVVATIAYPDIAAKAANEMMVQWASSEKSEQWMDDLIESPGYKLMKDAGLYIANIRSAKLSAKEEDFATNLASKIPGAGKLVDASERAYVAYLNKMRVDIFNQGVELLQNDGYSFATNPKAYKTLANYVNAVTGRGSLGGGALEKAGPALNALMFSPRLLASRIRLLTMLADPRLYKKENRIVRNMYLKDMSKFVGFGLTVLALAALAGADVEDDPRSTDFGKIKVGDTRWDIWGGFQQPIRAFVQATLEERKSTTTGKIVKLDGSGYGGETGGDVLLRFFRGKLAPVPAFLVNAYTGKDVMGTPFELGPSLLQMSYPLVIQSVVESAKKDGVAFGVLATGVPSLLGVGVQTYGANDFLKQGVDDKSINLLLSKKAIAIEPNELDTKVFDINTGEDRKMTDEEFKKYYADWADYIKLKLRDNYDEYKDMSVDEFETEFRSIKSEATKLAKEDISGVSNSTKTISYRDGDESESYKLTPEELKYRQSLNEQYISRHGNIYNKELRDAIRDGKSPEEAAIIANKRLTSKANEYSRKVILKQRKRGRGYDF